MIRALIYLQAVSLANACKMRVRRLCDPRYLIAACAGVAYFYFFLFRPNGSAAGGVDVPEGQIRGLVEALAALGLFGAMGLVWLVPGSKAALVFTEAEVAHLFAAPVSRRALVHYKLLKSQVQILFSVIFLTLVSGRWAALDGGVPARACGLWLLFSVSNLHRVAAGFFRERLSELGIGVVRRRLLAGGLPALIVAVTWLLMDRGLPESSENDAQNILSLLGYVRAALETPPLCWVLVPFGWLLKPALAAGWGDFFLTAWPGLLLLAGHYLWIMRMDVAFEEASVALSHKHALAVEDMRSGRWPGGGPKRKRPEPFVLSPTGRPCMAFLWKNLITAGPLCYPRYWLLAGTALLGLMTWFGLGTGNRLVIGGMFGIGMAVGVYGLFFGPVLARPGVNRLLDRLDVIKTCPLAGWQVILGEMLAPMILLCVFEWIVSALVAMAVLFLQQAGEADPSLVLTGLCGTWLLMVPVAGLLFALNYAGALLFPAWMGGAGQPGAGIERFGQRLIFLAGYLMVMVLALVPAVIAGAVPFLIVYLFFERVALGLGLGLGTVFVVLGLELVLVLRWLGWRYEQFDLSAELPR